MADLASYGYRIARRGLFRIGGGDPERAHRWTMAQLQRMDKYRWMQSLSRKVVGVVEDPVRLFGLDFPNRIGLAAGMAKNGEALRAWPALGFGHAEIGTVTWKAQPGNDLPRLFRLPVSGGLINRMGFNNHGARALAARLRKYGEDAEAVRANLGYPVGVSLGKSKLTPLDEAVADYVNSMRVLRDLASYVAVNVSSPNTPGLRSLQDKGFLTELIAALRAEAPAMPLLVKIAPDLTHGAIDDVLAVCREHDVAGLIATNTTIERGGLAPSEQHLGAEVGGLSGAPLTVMARDCVRYIAGEVGGELPIIGVGGIGSAADALAMIDAGADLLQIYSALIYQGPSVVRNVAAAVRDGS
ncbi:quinone-dependent dihydroorotate dehydrogenase [Cumulibacter soli]|uniref:quinone-dependent dihydroorotate dehydrogenase n=1 Tax=Cumulibacter soli TaxID=2546344 RepID=UPI00106739B9|nr:quinone-dependent dihydroorotate dehydrogenase [Cumulibacter soli]